MPNYLVIQENVRIFAAQSKRPFIMITVANPIYDIVFKYLIEDERIARTILSALLKKEVVAVETRRNEYSNIGRDNLSVFRIDFGATIQEADGSRHLPLKAHAPHEPVIPACAACRATVGRKPTPCTIPYTLILSVFCPLLIIIFLKPQSAAARQISRQNSL
jgi:hypothetical protein